ncbi:MAG: recombinase RecA [Planctomycetota bacterium]|nr:MAG: recombinase RecA [Planctomycetota bacterium]
MTQNSSSKDPDRKAALDAALQQVDKQFGKGSIMKLGSKEKVDVPSISSGCLSLDLAIGMGGFPRGRIIEIFGQESSGKTTVALHAAAEAQRKGGVAAFVDAEHALDPIYAKRLGVDINELLISQPDYGEQAMEIVELLVKSNAVDIIVVDSVAALVPKAEIEGDFGDNHVGLHARLMSQALRKLAGHVSKSRTCLIFINQIRMNLNNLYGNPETTTGGISLKFYASVRIEIRRITTIKDGDLTIGNVVKAKIVKNKISPPFKTADFEIMFNRGISNESSIINLGSEMNIIEKSGTWYTYNGQQIGHGREEAKEFLRENPEIKNKLIEIISKTYQEVEAIDFDMETDDDNEWKENWDE